MSTFDKHIRSAAAGPQAHTPVPLQQPKNGLALASAQGGSTPMQLRDNRVRPLMKAQ